MEVIHRSIRDIFFLKDWQHSGNIGIGLCQRDPGLQPRQCAVAKVRRRLGKVDAQRKNQIEWGPQKSEAFRHHTDHLARSGVDRHHAPNHTRIAAKAALPISAAQNHGLRGARLVVGG